MKFSIGDEIKENCDHTIDLDPNSFKDKVFLCRKVSYTSDTLSTNDTTYTNDKVMLNERVLKDKIIKNVNINRHQRVILNSNNSNIVIKRPKIRLKKD
jgi:hypothetical protein